MGLIGWIKGKYYNSRLNKADKLVRQHEFIKAEDIYRQLLGKQPMAVVHLANRYVMYSDGVKAKLSALKTIVELRQFTDAENLQMYEAELNSHIAKISDLASSKFYGQDYNDAVLLINAIAPYKSQDSKFTKRVHQYHANLSFNKLIRTSTYDTYLNGVINELKSYSPESHSDIEKFCGILCEKKFW